MTDEAACARAATATSTAAAPAPRARAAAHPARPWLRRIAAAVFLLLVAALIAWQARTVDWGGVATALAALPAATLVAAAGLAAASFLLYSTFDLLGRHLSGHHLGAGTVMGVAFVSYAFNLNLGTLVGGVGFRWRLYARLGLDGDTIARVLAFSVLTNWLGYLMVAGAAFCLGPPALPPDWGLGSAGLRALGAVLLALALGWPLLCAVARGKVWRLRGHALQAPSWRIALLQLAMAGTNWALMGGVVWLLMQQVPYAQVLAVLLVGGVAGVVAHMPAGLGVLEAVFVALLSHRLPQDRILAALIGYRALYYLAPLAVATLAFLAMEWRARRGARPVAGRSRRPGGEAPGRRG